MLATEAADLRKTRVIPECRNPDGTESAAKPQAAASIQGTILMV
jgi:hypothetical protein